MNAQTLAAYATVLGVGIALGGAVVGGLWRWWTWRQEHGTLVTAQIGMGFLTFGPNLVEAANVTVYNRSKHPVRVTGVAIETNDGSKRVLAQIMPQPGAGIPGVIGPHDSAVPYDLALDASGNVYVSEPSPFVPGNDRIQKFSPTGVPLAQWGRHGGGPGEFSDPTGSSRQSRQCFCSRHGQQPDTGTLIDG